jgi:hypothetical protein
MSKDRNVDIIHDLDGHRIVVIHDIRFRGRQHIDWDEVKGYLRSFIGAKVKIENTDDLVYIGPDLPDEFTGSEYTESLRGAAAKAKANAAQGLPELILTAWNKRYQTNKASKHNKDARFGWYKYDARFALPVYDNEGNIERYNVFQCIVVVRCAANRKLYIYDLLGVKKERESLPTSVD